MAKKTYISDEIHQKIAGKIKSLRFDAGFTSYETFALEFHLDRKQYWRMEKGVNITINSLIKILNIHGMSLADFFVDL